MLFKVLLGFRGKNIFVLKIIEFKGVINKRLYMNWVEIKDELIYNFVWWMKYLFIVYV